MRSTVNPLPLISTAFLLAVVGCGPGESTTVEPAATEESASPSAGSSETAASPSPSPEPTDTSAPEPPETDEDPGPEPAADTQPVLSGAPFGTSVAVPYPVGAYEHEYVPGNTADVVYTLGGVTSPSSGQVDFSLTVDVPYLERVLGFGHLSAECEVDGSTTSASVTITTYEAEQGSYTFPGSCSVPAGTGSLGITVTHGTETVVFAGSVS
ncbi:hypothetical protein [Nocardiopsis sp. LOL_012]|uniref:hypothetical protein n=1 Tax=Nocardiopsis sp. LOL_012 TaxID=3345409 RepID=UPI003A848EBD